MRRVARTRAESIHTALGVLGVFFVISANITYAKNRVKCFRLLF